MIQTQSMQKTLKTRSGLDLTTAYQKLQSLLTNGGLRPFLNILDNECLNVLKTSMREVNEKFQLVPTHIHQRDSASHQDFHEVFYSWNLEQSQGLPAPSMVPTYPTRHSHAQLTPTISHEPKNFRLCTTAWRIKL